MPRRAAFLSPFRTRSKAARWSRRRARINPALPIIARSHSEEETEHLKKHGATKVIMGEEEIARAMLSNLSSVTI